MGRLNLFSPRLLNQTKLFANLGPARSLSLTSVVSAQQHRQQNRYESRYRNDKSNTKKVVYYGAILGASLVGTKVAYNKIQSNDIFSDTKTKSDQVVDDNKVRLFSRDEVSKHNSLDKGVWITYKGNVYDITEFIRHHPGGSHTIMMGAGGDVEPFWQTYTVHNASEVQNLLATYKIGELHLEDTSSTQSPNQQGELERQANPYDSDPKRNPLLKVLTEQPFNAETPAKLLPTTYITPDEIFFVRNHLPVPEVDLDDYSLTICLGTDGDLDNLKTIGEFTLDDLKTKFKPHTVDSVIQCSGNRRSDLKKFKEIKGLDWNVGAISNARWTGVRLIDLLESLNINLAADEHRANIKHIQMEGLDCDMTGQSYGASIGADLAMDPNKEVILAYEMNGKPLSRDHGFPLRFVAPGVTGARNVKWLGKIILSHEESNSHWQRKDYKSFSPNVDMFNVDFEQSASVQETPVQSAICDPVDGEEVRISLNQEVDKENRQQAVIPVKGYAFSGGGKMIIRVDISIDGGQNWMTADLLDQPKTENSKPDYTNRNQVYSWTRWSLNVPIPAEIIKTGSGSMEIICRAFDSSYNSQPERAETIWNVRGVLNNSWHKIKLNVKSSN